MKQINITIHPFSALAGMALLGLVLVTSGAMPLQGSSSTRDVSAIEVVSDPHPRNYVRIVEGTPYTVPSGKLLVPTAFGSNGWSYNGGASYADYRITANGIEVWRELKQGRHYSSFWGNAPNELSAVIPTGLAFVEQTIVSVGENDISSTAILLGYLVDA